MWRYALITDLYTSCVGSLRSHPLSVLAVSHREPPPQRRPGAEEGSTPNGIRTRVAGGKGRCPGPLDYGGPGSGLPDEEHTGAQARGHGHDATMRRIRH